MADVIITGGGTGGHLYPALAVADALRDLWPSGRILFVGTPDRLESRVVPSAGYNFVGIPARGLSRHPVEAMQALGLLAIAIARARALLLRERPKVVLGTGGYVSAPVLLAARWLGIPVVLQEQNVVPGKVNQWIARWARAVVISLPGGDHHYPHRELLLLGNPIRLKSFARSQAEARRELALPDEGRVMLVTGGSQGARRINEAVRGLIPRIMAETAWTVYHVAGPGHVAEVGAGCDAAWGDRYKVLGYHDDLPAAIVASDLVIGRAGATTLAEVTVAGKPMVLVPYPHAGGHQRQNAAAAVAAGAALELADESLTTDALAQALLPLLIDGDRLATMALASAGLGRPHAAEDLAKLLMGVARAP